MYKISLTKVYRAVFSLKAADVKNAPQHRTNKSIDQSNSSFPRFQTASWHLHVAEWHEGEEMLRGSTAATRCQTPRCEGKQTCKSALTVIERDTDNSVLLCCKHRRNIFYTNFLCLHLFECKYDTARAALLFLVRWSLATNESFMRGFIFKERIKS